MASKQKKSPKAKSSKVVAAKKQPAPAKKSAKPAAKKSAPAPAKKVAAKKPVPAKKSAPVKKAAPVKAKPAPKPVVAKKAASSKKPAAADVEVIIKPNGLKPSAFVTKQRERLLALKDTLLDSMSGVAKDSLRSRAEGSEASAFGMHQADAGSDAYDRDFALSLLSQEQDSLYEIDQALKRIDTGSYGMCEMSGKPIPHPRLEALPFTRYTVECQSELEKRNRFQRVRQPVTSLFGLADEEGDGEEDDNSSDSKE